MASHSPPLVALNWLMSPLSDIPCPEPPLDSSSAVPNWYADPFIPDNIHSDGDS